VYPVVDGAVIGEIVAGWTGIPIGKMVRNESKTVLAFATTASATASSARSRADALAQAHPHVASQLVRSEAADRRVPLGRSIRRRQDRNRIGRSRLLYGGDRNMVVIICREFKEEYQSLQLIGSPPATKGLPRAVC